jgi:hypothetical protein
MKRHPLIAFTGVISSGKSTATEALLSLPEKPYIKMAFADPLKSMVAFLTSETDKTATPWELCGKSVREAYQTLGTEWGRNMIGQDIWLRAMEIRIKQARTRGVWSIVVDDCRFDNEAALLRRLGARIIQVVRPGYERGLHSSEAGIDPRFIDYTLVNNGSVEEIHQKVKELCIPV